MNRSSPTVPVLGSGPSARTRQDLRIGCRFSTTCIVSVRTNQHIYRLSSVLPAYLSRRFLQAFISCRSLIVYYPFLQFKTMSTGGRAEGNSSSHPSSPIPRGPPTPSTSSAFSDGNRSAHSILADRYLLLTELGRGANGRVFKAIDLQDVRYVAVKQIPVAGISKEQLALVVGEIDLLKNLDHENIVQYYDSIKTNNHLYIILELMESGALAGVVKHMSFVSSPEKWVAMSVAQVLKGLTYLHAQGVVHRDIKGANILTTKDVQKDLLFMFSPLSLDGDQIGRFWSGSKAC